MASWQLIRDATATIPNDTTEVSLAAQCQPSEIKTQPFLVTRKDAKLSSLVKKEEAHRLVEHLPENATWDDLMHEIYVRETIERGLQDSNEGKTKDVNEIRKKYGLPE